MTKKILEMNSKQRITGGNRRTFLKGAGAPAASVVVAAESTLAQQPHGGAAGTRRAPGYIAEQEQNHGQRS
jgi:hypothetical protein